jgi:hypothetical protein
MLSWEVVGSGDSLQILPPPKHIHARNLLDVMAALLMR